MGAIRHYLLFPVLSLLLVACASASPESTSDQQISASQVSLGQLVEVIERDGAESRFTVDRIGDSGIGGGDYFVSYNDIDQITIIPPDLSTSDKFIKEGKIALLGITTGVLVALLLW